MASDANKSTVCFFAVLLFSCHVSSAHSSASPQTEGRVILHQYKGLFRSRRQACANGVYSHENRTCCMCGAGLRLVSHCLLTPNDRQCEACDRGTFNSHPNAQESCEPCTSCDEPNANLEVEEPCTRARNTKCRCKKDHYCSSGTGTCRICHPCTECGTEGVKIACTDTSNTICNEKTEGVTTGAVIGIIVSIVIAAVITAVLLLLLWRQGKLCSRHSTPAQRNSNETDVELPLLNEFSDHHMPEIAVVLGWKDMRDVAMLSGMSKTVIESCKLDHPGDWEEQTIQLLGKWKEKQGRSASNDLIKILHKSGKKDKAEKITQILSCDPPV